MAEKMGAVETSFAEIVWEHEPLSSGELVRLSEEKLKWKKSTTYTVLRRLCERGILQNDGGTVTALVTKEEYEASQSERFVEETFRGSLPAFLTAFTRRRKLSEAEIAELEALIRENRG